MFGLATTLLASNSHLQKQAKQFAQHIKAIATTVQPNFEDCVMFNDTFFISVFCLWIPCFHQPVVRAHHAFRRHLPFPIKPHSSHLTLCPFYVKKAESTSTRKGKTCVLLEIT